MAIAYAPVRATAEVNEAIVKIYTVSKGHNYHEPWQMRGQAYTQGSGCIIDGHRILTNAHVVADSMFIQVRRAGVADKFHAQVESIDYESDLAILSVKKEAFFSGTTPVPIGELAKMRDNVAVYGFPDGGDKLSITEGVVSRIDHLKYAYSGAHLLIGQIDAPINSGNSGGPVIFDNTIVGVAFQGMGGEYENIGYMIPTPIIRHFLEDIKDGQVDGFPTLGILMQKLENPDMRRFYNLNAQGKGILVNKIYVHSPVHDILFPGDIIINVDDTDIASDGTIEFRKGQRTYFGFIIQKKQIGESIRMKILRNGVEQILSIKLTIPQGTNRLIPFEHEKIPRYYIYAGLVFEPLTLNYLHEFGNGMDWPSYAPVSMVDYFLNQEKSEKREEMVFLVKVLAHELNVGFHDFENVIIASINDTPIYSFFQLIELLESNTRDYITFKTGFGLEITLNNENVIKKNKEILKKHQVPSRQSEPNQ